MIASATGTSAALCVWDVVGWIVYVCCECGSVFSERKIVCVNDSVCVCQSHWAIVCVRLLSGLRLSHRVCVGPIGRLHGVPQAVHTIILRDEPALVTPLPQSLTQFVRTHVRHTEQGSQRFKNARC